MMVPLSAQFARYSISVSPQTLFSSCSTIREKARYGLGYVRLTPRKKIAYGGTNNLSSKTSTALLSVNFEL
jgi:hypothetical protein